MSTSKPNPLNKVQYQVLKNTFLSAHIPVAITLDDTIENITNVLTDISSRIQNGGTDVYLNGNDEYALKLSVQQISLEDYHNLEKLAPSTIYVISDDLMSGFKTEYLSATKVDAIDLSAQNISADLIDSKKIITQAFSIGDGIVGDRAFSQGYNIIANGTASFAQGLNNKVNEGANYAVIFGENNIAKGSANLILGWYAGDNGNYRTFVCNFDRVYDTLGYPMDNLGGNITDNNAWYYLSGDPDLTFQRLSRAYSSPSAIYPTKKDISVQYSVTNSDNETEQRTVMLSSLSSWNDFPGEFIESLSCVYNQMTGNAGTDWKWYLAREVSAKSIPAYISHGPMTFNINLQNDINGFYIGERNLQEIIRQEQCVFNNELYKASINDSSLYINTNDCSRNTLDQTKVKGQTFTISAYYTNNTQYKSVPQYAHDYCYLNSITIIQNRINKTASYNINDNTHDYNVIGIKQIDLSAALVKSNEVGEGTQLKETGYIDEDKIVAFAINTVKNYSDYNYQRTLIEFNNVKLNTNSQQYALVFFDSYRYLSADDQGILQEIPLSDYNPALKDQYKNQLHGSSIKIGIITNNKTASNRLINDDYTISYNYYKHTMIVAMNVKFPEEPIIEDSVANEDGTHDKYVITINNGQVIPVKIG